MLLHLINPLLLIVPILIGLAYVTLLERKVLGSIQIRKGPTEIGVVGLLQPLADGLKLFVKETIIPSQSNQVIFLFAPILALILALLSWIVIPYNYGAVVTDLNIGILFMMAVSSISVYAILFSGWSSNSKYAFFGSIRAAAQMISYEVSLGLIIITVVICANSFNLTNIMLAQSDIWFIIPLFPAGVMFIISALAETNRAPFDLTEGESELVSGFNVEYAGMTFALFFLAEYAHIILMSILIVILFFGGFSWLFPFKVGFFVYFFIWVRGSFPRIRYDQLMALIWKSYLPLSIGMVILTPSLLLI